MTGGLGAVLLHLAHAKPRAFVGVEMRVERASLCAGESVAIGLVGVDGAGAAAPLRRGERTRYTVSWDIAAVGADGVARMPEDAAASWGRPGVLVLRDVDGGAVRHQATLAPRYDCALVAEFSGAPGEEGFDGLGPHDVANLRPGTGGAGGDGGAGAQGPRVVVRVRRASDPGSGVAVLQVAIEDEAGRRTRHAFAEESGSLLVRANGGAGGRGGRGGIGGSIRRGGAGGRGGDGGDGGPGGAGGGVIVVVDPAASGHTAGRAVATRGGDGAKGGRGAMGGSGGNGKRSGDHGKDGSDGSPGMPGPPIEPLTQTVTELW